MNNQSDLIRRVVQNAIDAQNPTPIITVTIGGNAERYDLATLEAMTEIERIKCAGAWGAIYIAEFVAACHSALEFAVISLPVNRAGAVDVSAHIPGRQIIIVQEVETLQHSNP